MRIELTGVIDDGRPRAPGVPTDTRRTLSIPIGSSVDLDIRVLDSNGMAVQLPVNSVVFTLKKSAKDMQKLAQKIGPAVAAPSVMLSLAPSDTKNGQPGRYVWDLWFTDGAGKRNAVIELSPLDLEFTATPPP